MYSINTDISQVLIDCSTFLSSLHQRNESTRRSFTRTYKCRYSSQTPKKKMREKEKITLRESAFSNTTDTFCVCWVFISCCFWKAVEAWASSSSAVWLWKKAQSLSHKHTTTNLILRLWKLFLNNFTRQLRIKKIHSERVQVQRSKFTSETRFWNFMFKRKHE